MTHKKCQICNSKFKARNEKIQLCEKCFRKKVQEKNNKVKKNSYLKKKLKNKYNIDITKCCYKKCNWHKHGLECDVHHIIPAFEGGSHELENLTLLCPNHHRLMHANLISKKEIKTIKDLVDLRGIEPRSQQRQKKRRSQV